MELFTSSTEEKEKEVRAAFIGAIHKLWGFNLPWTDIRVEFLWQERDVIYVSLAIEGSKEAFSLVDDLFNHTAGFFDALREEVSEQLFKYLLFNNRISYMSFYLNLYKELRLTITEEVFGGSYSSVFTIAK